jgi:hypothetical protein
MAATPEKTTVPKNETTTGGKPGSSKIDLTSPAGSENSLGEESVRDGRPSTDDATVEAIDEETPVVPALPDR